MSGLTLFLRSSVVLNAALLGGVWMKSEQLLAPRSVPSVKLKLTLQADKPTIHVGEEPGFHAFVENQGITEVTLFQPGERSNKGPSIEWSITSPGNAKTIRRKHYFGYGNISLYPQPFTLSPGGREELFLRGYGWEPDVAYETPGVYRLSLRYRTRQNDSQDGPIRRYCSEIAPCDLQSNSIVINVVP